MESSLDDRVRQARMDKQLRELPNSYHFYMTVAKAVEAALDGLDGVLAPVEPAWKLIGWQASQAALEWFLKNPDAIGCPWDCSRCAEPAE